jgi:predicted lysophospholipase L1 biosynthesis ABC-type transport system permease subunit
MAISRVPDQFMPLVARGSLFVVRTQASPELEMGAIRRALEKINGEILVYATRTMDKIISDSLAAQRFSMILLGIFTVLALILWCGGIYGVISDLAGQRTHEIGIRVARGASRRDVLRLILGQGAKVALIGVGVGIVASLALTRLMAKLLFGVSALDPLTFLAVACSLILVALAACYIPARRAMRVDPMVALVCELAPPGVWGAPDFNPCRLRLGAILLFAIHPSKTPGATYFLPVIAEVLAGDELTEPKKEAMVADRESSV